MLNKLADTARDSSDRTRRRRDRAKHRMRERERAIGMKNEE